MTESTGSRIEVQCKHLRESRVVNDPDAPFVRPLRDGEARLRISRFALTANNITYAAFGEAMKYWQFFTGADPAWGNIPVWGFAEVSESRADGVQVGERCYGFWPMACWLVVQPRQANARDFVDASAHRQALPAAYNQIQRCAADPAYSVGQEAQQAVLRPLFTTSCCSLHQRASLRAVRRRRKVGGWPAATYRRRLVGFHEGGE